MSRFTVDRKQSAKDEREKDEMKSGEVFQEKVFKF